MACFVLSGVGACFHGFPAFFSFGDVDQSDCTIGSGAKRAPRPPVRTARTIRTETEIDFPVVHALNFQYMYST